jgi:hypothetical protein
LYTQACDKNYISILKTDESIGSQLVENRAPPFRSRLQGVAFVRSFLSQKPKHDLDQLSQSRRRHLHKRQKLLPPSSWAVTPYSLSFGSSFFSLLPGPLLAFAPVSGFFCRCVKLYASFILLLVAAASCLVDPSIAG